jgi:hypothetical protein
VALPGRAFLLAEYSGKNADADLTDTDGCVAKPTAAAEHVGPNRVLKKYLAGGTACPTSPQVLDLRLWRRRFRLCLDGAQDFFSTLLNLRIPPPLLNLRFFADWFLKLH